MDRIPLTRPNTGAAELDELRAVLDSGMLVQGSRVAAFESALSERLNQREVVAVHTGTSAIRLALIAIGVGEGDEVIVPDFCFPSVAAAVIHAGATPVLCDVDPDSFCMRAEDVRPLVGPRTRAVLAVHQFGIPCGVSGLRDALRDRPGVAIVEDSACALGARDAAGPCGAQADVGCFSFHPRKIITTGEGGAVVTADPAVAARLRALRNHGMVREDGKIVFERLGWPARMSDVHAAIGLAQMKRLDAIVAGRRSAALAYRARLSTVGGIVAPDALWADGRVYQGLVLRVADDLDRDRVVAGLRARSIESTIGTYAIHRQRAFASVCRTPVPLPGSVRAERSAITLPLWPDMDESVIDRVVDALGTVMQEART